MNKKHLCAQVAPYYN